VNITTFRDQLAASLKRVVEDREVLEISRPNGEAVVVMAKGEYESWMETLHLLRSPANARRLFDAIADADSGKLTEFDPTAR
jgi:antitoxin YefM